MQNKLFIISNESISFSQNSFFCDNLDMKSTPEGLKKSFDVNIIARKSKKQRSHKINLEKIKIYKNIIAFLFSIFKSCKEKNSKYLIISISPFTFWMYFACTFRKKPIVYLRSDGYKEYRSIFGFIGPIFYHVMFFSI